MHAMAQVDDVTSPTFNLMQSYDVTCADGKKALLWHLDLYRLDDMRELQALGLDELMATYRAYRMAGDCARPVAAAFCISTFVSVLTKKADDTRSLMFFCQMRLGLAHGSQR